MNGFGELPLARHVNELRRITGGSETCGWMQDEIAFLLYALVKWYKPDLVVQTGHLWGKSASVVLDALNDGFLTGESAIEDEPQWADKVFSAFVDSNRPRPGAPRFLSVDPCPLSVSHSAEGIAHLQRLHPNFTFYPMSSDVFFKQHCAALAREFAGKRILAIIDGDHSLTGCLYDIDNAWRLGAGLIFLDDTRWIPYIGKVAHSFAARRGYQRIDLSLYNGIAVLYRDPGTVPASPNAQVSWPQRVLDSLAAFSYRIAHRRGAAEVERLSQRLLSH